MPIGHFSTHSGNDKTRSQPVEQNGIQQERDAFGDRRSKTDGICNARDRKEKDLQCSKCRVVAGPMIFCLLSVIGCFVHNVRSRREKCFHLIQGTLYIHLSEIYQSGEILRMTCRRRYRARRSHCLAGSCCQRISTRWQYQSTTMPGWGGHDYCDVNGISNL